MVLREDNVIETVTNDRSPHYEPFGWHHWPEHPWFSYQFRRGLGETQEGGGTVSECLQAAARMIPGDTESWDREWLALAERNFTRGEDAAARGHVRTAMNCWLRGRRLLPAGGVLSRSRRPPPTGDLHEDGALEPPFSGSSPAAGRGARDPVRGQESLSVFCASALRRRAPAVPHLDG